MYGVRLSLDTAQQAGGIPPLRSVLRFDVQVRELSSKR